MSVDAQEAELLERWQKRSPYDASFWALILVGLFLMVLPFTGPVRRALGDRLDLLGLDQLILGFALIYLAFLLRDVRVLRQRNFVLMQTMLAAFRGNRVARQDHEAIDILVSALQGPDEGAREAAARQLRRLTGQDFGEDADAWSKWWSTNRERYVGPIERGDDPTAEEAGR